MLFGFSLSPIGTVFNKCIDEVTRIVCYDFQKSEILWDIKLQKLKCFQCAQTLYAETLEIKKKKKKMPSQAIL